MIRLLLAAAIVLPCVGCASISRGTTENISITSTPAGATAELSGLDNTTACGTPRGGLARCGRGAHPRRAAEAKAESGCRDPATAGTGVAPRGQAATAKTSAGAGELGGLRRGSCAPAQARTP